MGATSVYSEPLRRRYVAPRCSHACLFQLVITVALIVVPFFFAIQTGSFWTKLRPFLERPHVEPAAAAYVALTDSLGHGIHLTTDQDYARALPNGAASTGAVSLTVMEWAPARDEDAAAAEAADTDASALGAQAAGQRARVLRVSGAAPIAAGAGVVAARIALVVRVGLVDRYIEIARGPVVVGSCHGLEFFCFLFFVFLAPKPFIFLTFSTFFCF
jgi:hypothetical protein